MNHDEEVEVGDDSDESELSQLSFKHPLEVFQAASEDPAQTSSHIFDIFCIAITQVADFFDVFFEFSPS